jgi:hypothetical protein
MRVRSSLIVSAARARAGAMVRVHATRGGRLISVNSENLHLHGGRAAQARLWRLLGPARARHGGVGGHVWSARGGGPRHLVSRPPRPPWRVALTPDGRIQRPPQNHSLLVNGCVHDGPDSGLSRAPRRANHAKGDACPCLFLQGCPTWKQIAACENMTFSWTPFCRAGRQGHEGQ